MIILTGPSRNEFPRRRASRVDREANRAAAKRLHLSSGSDGESDAEGGMVAGEESAGNAADGGGPPEKRGGEQGAVLDD